MLAACASCYARLRTANYQVRNDPKQRERAERITGEPYDGSVIVYHVLDVLVNHLGLEAIRAAVRRPLAGLRVACYYGCLLTRPPEVVAFDDAEHPTAMDKLVAALGAEPVDWPYKTECCGASLSMTHSGVVSRLSHRLVDMARQAGAQCIAVACPLCQVNLDLRQADARKAHGELPETPALYITQLLGLALGLGPKELGLKALSVSPDALWQSLPSPAGREAGGEGSGARANPIQALTLTLSQGRGDSWRRSPKGRTAALPEEVDERETATVHPAGRRQRKRRATRTAMATETATAHRVAAGAAPCWFAAAAWPASRPRWTFRRPAIASIWSRRARPSAAAWPGSTRPFPPATAPRASSRPSWWSACATTTSTC